MTDEDIKNCRRSTDWPSLCQRCPVRVRCDELMRAERARELNLEPPEEAKEWTSGK